MQTLPPDVLLHVWNRLRNGDRLQKCTDQWALRCTCRALRQATAPLIFSLDMCPVVEAAAGANRSVHNPEDALSALHTTLHQFPSDAVLRKLCMGGHESTQMLSLVLQSFPSCASAKLAGLHSLRIIRAAVDVGAMSSIVLACPQLQDLDMCTCSLLGPVLLPLAHLPSLRSVIINSCWTSTIDPRLCQTVTGLTQITELGILSVYDCEQVCKSAELVRQASRLTHLRHLSLDIEFNTPGSATCLEPLTALTRLTCLHLVSADRPLSRPLPPSPAHNPYTALAPLHGLASLEIPHDLTTALAQALSLLPHLTNLSGGGVEHGADLSPLVSSLRSLTLTDCQTLDELAALHELTGLTRLRLECGSAWRPGVGSLCRLEAGISADLADHQIQSLDQAVEVVNRVFWPQPDAVVGWELHLQCSAGGSPLRRHLALSALAPLNRLRADLHGVFFLVLDKEWDVSAAHVQQLQLHVPLLCHLSVSVEGPAFATFAGALGSSLANLRTLTILFPLRERGLPGAVVQALLAMAAARAGNNLPLKVKHRLEEFQLQGKGAQSWRNLMRAAARQQSECQLPDLVQFCLAYDDAC